MPSWTKWNASRAKSPPWPTGTGGTRATASSPVMPGAHQRHPEARREALAPLAPTGCSGARVRPQENNGLLGRNFLKGQAGDAINALLCGAGHNLRKILARLRSGLNRWLRACPQPTQGARLGWLRALQAARGLPADGEPLERFRRLEFAEGVFRADYLAWMKWRNSGSGDENRRGPELRINKGPGSGRAVPIMKTSHAISLFGGAPPAEFLCAPRGPSSARPRRRI